MSEKRQQGGFRYLEYKENTSTIRSQQETGHAWAWQGLRRQPSSVPRKSSRASSQVPRRLSVPCLEVVWARALAQNTSKQGFSDRLAGRHYVPEEVMVARERHTDITPTHFIVWKFAVALEDKMATAIYANQPGAHYGYPQPPPSPPMDEAAKCSLPSISNLLVMADAGSPTSEHSPQSQTASSTKGDTRPNSSHHSGSGPSRAALPPTPPMSTDASFEGYNSPSTKSLTQVPVISGTANYYYETTPPVEDIHRQHMNPVMSRLPMQPQSYTPQAFASSYLNQPGMSTYYTPPISTAQSQISGLFYQRPLPQVSPSNYFFV
ncbi:hypothetical protein FHL15_005122 [Xylaria flabelliformis]|uniref:Uncharacterized protein n=1 Tax=Xylaria flabelliformis TaxID=2512241 RepID=A0A553I1H3_9PEZI|nr:hypothetical protein FHL15_005122 [Xylaria flabelliformis]